jgi:hypothetical protein
MTGKKYSHLVKKLNFQKSPVGGYVWFEGTALEGLDLTFGWYYASRIGDLSLGQSNYCLASSQGTRHTHPFSECLVFAGLDYNHPNDLSAEIELSLGEKGKNYTISSPAAVAVPAGLPHNPVVTRKLTKPFSALVISLSGKYQAGESSVKTLNSAQDQQQLVKRLSSGICSATAETPTSSPLGTVKDSGFDLNFTWAFHKGTGTWHKRDPHVHPYDEILLFVGCDPDNPEYLGAEIEIAMGQEQEKHVFHTSTVVVAPKELVHCPLNTRKVDQPYCFSAICLNTEHITTWLGEDTGIGL